MLVAWSWMRIPFSGNAEARADFGDREPIWPYSAASAHDPRHRVQRHMLAPEGPPSPMCRSKAGARLRGRAEFRRISAPEAPASGAPDGSRVTAAPETSGGQLGGSTRQSRAGRSAGEVRAKGAERRAHRGAHSQAHGSKGELMRWRATAPRSGGRARHQPSSQSARPLAAEAPPSLTPSLPRPSRPGSPKSGRTSPSDGLNEGQGRP